MDKFTQHTGVAAPIMRNNIDTDTIIPSREMRTVSKTGLADGMFAPWRYIDADTREPDPEFVLNQSQYQDASVIISGNNFGCGSSREHAVWALKEFGIRCIIAEGFGNIFYRNCVRNGILTIRLPRLLIDEMAAWVAADPQQHQIEIDLGADSIRFNDKDISFSVEGSDREMLLEGLDPIAVTQKSQSAIDAFQQADAERRPWLY